ncbi:HD domain-containing protein [Candidatus Microgenomates bacterium]|nr:MAG: HD domain-containing protein [Candidatus Microgenomates bacterium]
MRQKPDDIFTPQGRLADVAENPNLDFLMNVFNIPRVFGVSGFGGNWTVGKHSFATALIALFWARFNTFAPAKRDALVTAALTHDLHEAVTGDILPMFKSPEITKHLDRIQKNIINSLGITLDPTLTTDLKIVDLTAFLYEVKQVSPSLLQPKKIKLAQTIFDKQKTILLAFCTKQGIAKRHITRFLATLDL